ncbi:carbon-nitrogen hydrolase family protein [Rhodophyticola sp. CCM32]|nr:carbon-nitrogen hydrolase family protein [Rhodophyticola sp. CCM32]
MRVSMLQMTSGNRHAVNQQTVTEAAARAAGDGCDLLALPEAAGMMNKDKEDARRQITTEADDPFLLTCQELAARHGIWIQPGSTPVKAKDDRYLNHATLIDPTGAIVARYDKVHLFDVFLEGRPATGESSRYAPGAEAVLVDTPWGPWGLSICYDLRFPHLYRDYSKAGATVLFVPSAFTIPTGRAHWEVLLRARAIENGAWVIAAAQVGDHADGRHTWGHSIIISPWGEVICDLGGETASQHMVTLDIGKVASARQQIPSLKNERDYTFTRVSAQQTAPA